MRPIGFSTGALALSDVPRALAMLEGRGTTAIELSALRLAELEPLAALVGSLDLTGFSHVSFHAPSSFDARAEGAVVEALARAIAPCGFPIVVHPDTIHDYGPWRQLGALVAVENMDKRKAIGRTVRELARVFAELPEARFCFDIGHARQVDRTMNEAYFLLQDFGGRLAQLHVSEVDAQSRHDAISAGAAEAFQKVAHLIPPGVPLILEAPAEGAAIDAQIAMAARALAAPAER
jgi:hypothetical protein